jgi:hypothetical protein
VDGQRLDELARTLTTSPSRRQVLRALGGLVLSGAFGLLQRRDVEARKKGKKKRKHKPPPPVSPPPPGSPPPPPPPPPAICAGRDQCVRANQCHIDNADCHCWVRQETGVPFCGQLTGEAIRGCDECALGTICIDFTGCGVPTFGCGVPCANPLE